MYYGFIYRDGKPTDPMFKFNLTAGEGEHTLVATCAHYRGVRYKVCRVTGNWSTASEDGKTPVELKFTYITKDLMNSELKGVFDPEESSLKGTVTMPNSGLSGEFVFKRDPDFVRLYPPPSMISARKRWEFATASVLDRVRRDAWSSKQILKRMKDRRQYMELSLRRYYGRNLTKDEEQELLALYPGFYEADAQFYASLISIHLGKTTIFA